MLAALANGTGSWTEVFTPISETLTYAAPLVFTGLSVALAFVENSNRRSELADEAIRTARRVGDDVTHAGSTDTDVNQMVVGNTQTIGTNKLNDLRIGFGQLKNAHISPRARRMAYQRATLAWCCWPFGAKRVSPVSRLTTTKNSQSPSAGSSSIRSHPATNSSALPAIVTPSSCP